jgi:hypothetical protein
MMKNKFLRDVKLKSKDTIGFTFDNVNKNFYSYNEQTMHDVMKTARDSLKSGEIYLLQENNKTLSIDGIPYHILVIQGCGINTDLLGYIFDDLFLVDGMTFVFKSERIRDSIFNWLIKFCQVKNYTGDSDCNICFENRACNTLFTKCCNKEICACCLSSKESNSCPFCRKEY